MLTSKRNQWRESSLAFDPRIPNFFPESIIFHGERENRASEEDRTTSKRNPLITTATDSTRISRLINVPSRLFLPPTISSSKLFILSILCDFPDDKSIDHHLGFNRVIRARTTISLSLRCKWLQIWNNEPTGINGPTRFEKSLVFISLNDRVYRTLPTSRSPKIRLKRERWAKLNSSISIEKNPPPPHSSPSLSVDFSRRRKAFRWWNHRVFKRMIHERMKNRGIGEKFLLYV